MRDQFFTPTDVARRLVAILRSRTENCIADFAAGDGELLRAAESKWRGASIVATDVDVKCVKELRVRHPDWNVSRCDFLNQKSRKCSPLLRERKGTVTLALLNPPFSCRGGETRSVFLGEFEVRCSRSMSFVLHAIPYLASNGRIAAVVPAACLTSEKDADAWKLVREEFAVRKICTFGMKTFRSCAARTAIVYLRRRRKSETIGSTHKRKRPWRGI